MSNPLHKIGIYLGVMEEPEFDTPATTPVIPPTGDVRITTREPRGGSAIRTTSVVQVAPQLDLPVLDRIVTLHPRYYNEARTIGEHFREGNPVIINLSEMDESELKRIVDFASGLAFGLHGTIERITKKVFLISPSNVNVSNEDKSAAAQAILFNQS
ncbi:MAG: cell division protein SepF [Actinobacteria bacterium]|nr:cell division protein SepF [Actinomycetota bacterium]